ncbi:hypothetical protein K435DRAFT_961663 [Dendrothele bispora CBS 962.96]|uniref:TECPR1-like DysF domain-containing protein n=1 Tax=Dendrothele bispora (strain CBS 962.96) TaxID=1314807 RepID=A0A4V4HI27_DENBC|nr:hypothetical protein K435DRAFT_961663 [Dendrothele bispora CBS 962.96]
MSTSALPPPPLDLEGSSDLETVRQRLSPKKQSRLSASLPNLKVALHRPSKLNRPLKGKTTLEPPEVVIQHSDPDDPNNQNRNPKIDLSVSSFRPSDPFQDTYQWAVLYENQRGMTIFSTPLYSSTALLPTDPPPFTAPSSSSQNRKHVPNVSLKEYPLPDGNWRWVSKSWMIDMRSTGDVQYDGFEYNWTFRQHHWRPEVGPVSAGGWVRRRRWIRLMMCPGLKRRNGLEEEGLNSALSPTSSSPSRSRDTFDARRLSDALSFMTVSTAPERIPEMLEMWSGNVEEDWNMCRQFMKLVGRSDGGRLELWKQWLGSAKAEGKRVITVIVNKDDMDAGSAANSSISGEASPEDRLGCVSAVLDVHGMEILNLLVYPESKRRFIEMLKDAGIYLKHADGSLYKALQFHSLTSGLDIHANEESSDEEHEHD